MSINITDVQSIVHLLESQLKTSDPSSPSITALRTRLKESAYRLIISFPLIAAKDEVDVKLWRLVFYDQIVFYRKTSKKQEASMTALVKTINMGIGTVTGLLRGLVEGGVECQMISALLKDIGHIVTPTGKKVAQSTPELINMVYRLMIYLGDLFRYACNYCPEYAENKFALSRMVYEHAVDFQPEKGHAYNQMAVIAAFMDDPLDTLYCYLTSMIVPDHFTRVVQQNLQDFVKKDRGAAATVPWTLTQLARQVIVQGIPKKQLVIENFQGLDRLDWIRAACILIALQKQGLDNISVFAMQFARAVTRELPTLHDGHIACMALLIPTCPDVLLPILEQMEWPESVLTIDASWERLIRPYYKGNIPESPEDIFAEAVKMHRQSPISESHFTADSAAEELVANLEKNSDNDRNMSPARRLPGGISREPASESEEQLNPIQLLLQSSTNPTQRAKASSMLEMLRASTPKDPFLAAAQSPGDVLRPGKKNVEDVVKTKFDELFAKTRTPDELPPLPKDLPSPTLREGQFPPKGTLPPPPSTSLPSIRPRGLSEGEEEESPPDLARSDVSGSSIPTSGNHPFHSLPSASISTKDLLFSGSLVPSVTSKSPSMKDMLFEAALQDKIKSPVRSTPAPSVTTTSGISISKEVLFSVLPFGKAILDEPAKKGKQQPPSKKDSISQRPTKDPIFASMPEVLSSTPITIQFPHSENLRPHLTAHQVSLAYESITHAEFNIPSDLTNATYPIATLEQPVNVEGLGQLYVSSVDLSHV